jgi:hypothetical protein
VGVGKRIAGFCKDLTIHCSSTNDASRCAQAAGPKVDQVAPRLSLFLAQPRQQFIILSLAQTIFNPFALKPAGVCRLQGWRWTRLRRACPSLPHHARSHHLFHRSEPSAPPLLAILQVCAGCWIEGGPGCTPAVFHFCITLKQSHGAILNPLFNPPLSTWSRPAGVRRQLD